MYIYLFSFTILFLSTLLTFKLEVIKPNIYDPYATSITNGSKGLLLINLFIFMSITGFRDMIGGSDVYIYGVYFEKVPSLIDWISSGKIDVKVLNYFEKGYLLYNSFIKIFISDKHYFFLITAIVSYLLIYKTIIKYNNAILIFFMFISKFLLVGFSYNRQLLALCVVWFVIDYLYRGKILYYCLGIIIASSFHVSALVMFPLIFFRTIKFSKLTITLLFVASFLLGVTPLIGVFQNLLGNILGLSKISQGYSNTGNSSFHLFYFIESVFLIISIFFYRNYYYKNKSILIFNMLIIYVCFSLLTIKSSGINRFIWYYNIAFFVMFPRLLFHLFKQRILVIMVIFLYFPMIFFRGLIMRDGGDYMPYKVFFYDYPTRKDLYHINEI